MTRKKHRKKQMKPGEKVGLTLTQAERTLLHNAMHGVTEEIRDVIRATPTAQPVMLTLDDLNDLEGHVAAEANHTKDKKLRQRLDAISEKIQRHLDRHDDEPEVTESPATIGFLDRFVESLVGPRPLVEPLPTKSEEGEDQYGVKLTDKQRESLLHCTELSKGLSDKIRGLPEGLKPSGSPGTTSTNSPARSISPSLTLGPRTSSGSLPSSPSWKSSWTLSIWTNRTNQNGIFRRGPARSTSSRSR